jgi:glycosyltransferase involved in cell wall biosynthesis
MTSGERPRVLLIAEAANPEWVSVPLVGWSHGRALVELTGAHLVTQVRNRHAIERAGWHEGREFTALDSEPVAHPLWRFEDWLRRTTGLGWTVSTALAAFPYYYFEHLVWRRFGDAIARREYDVVHRLTPLSPTTPSLLARRCQAAGVPFVWGPLNGGVAWPAEFASRRRAEGEWLSYVRDAHKLLPAYRSTRRDAAAIIVGSRATWEQMAGHHERCVYIPENGIDPERFPAPVPARREGPLRVAFVGRLVPYKGADMLIEAAAPLVRAGKLHVDVIGDGPEMPALRELVEREGLGGGVALDGWVPHTRMHERLGRAQVLGFPSVREFGGGVVLEAMALGLVPVVVDYAGPAELVTAETGVRVPLGPREAVVAGFRRELAEMVEHPERLAAVGARARERVLAHFTWEAKARQTREVYRWVTGRRARPDFGMPFPDEAAALAAI